MFPHRVLSRPLRNLANIWLFGLVVFLPSVLFLWSEAANCALVATGGVINQPSVLRGFQGRQRPRLWRFREHPPRRRAPTKIGCSVTQQEKIRSAYYPLTHSGLAPWWGYIWAILITTGSPMFQNWTCWIKWKVSLYLPCVHGNN